MNEYREQDMENSTKAFESIKPILSKLLPGKIIPCESSFNDTTSIEFLLDSFCGIDYLVQDEVGIRGLASRIQFGTCYGTFTVRSERIGSMNQTEEIKRLNQLKMDYLTPYWTLQAYFDSPDKLNLKSLCIIKTKDLYHEIETNPKVVERESNNKFKVLHWMHIDKSKVKIWTAPSKFDINKIRNNNK